MPRLTVELPDSLATKLRGRFGDEADLGSALLVVAEEAFEARTMLTVTEAAEILGISGTRARDLASSGRFDGAIKDSAGWRIPLESVTARLVELKKNS